MHAPGAWGQLACNIHGVDAATLGRERSGGWECFPCSFITKRVDVSMGCQDCESHKSVMAAVAACSGAQGERRTTGPGRRWARAACQEDPTFPGAVDGRSRGMTCSCVL